MLSVHVETVYSTLGDVKSVKPKNLLVAKCWKENLASTEELFLLIFSFLVTISYAWCNVSSIYVKSHNLRVQDVSKDSKNALQELKVLVKSFYQKKKKKKPLFST